MRRASFIEHLEELRTRLIKSLLAVAFTTIVAYRFSSEILSFFTKHIGQLVFIYPSEAFITHLVISIAVGNVSLETTIASISSFEIVGP